MTKKEKIGEYLNKSIFFIHIKDFTEIEKWEISNALVLLILKISNWGKLELTHLIRVLEKSKAQGIGVCGVREKEAFDILIKELSIPTIKEHIMTSTFHEKDDLENIYGFLISAIPDGDRWDSWEEYLILIIGDNGITEELKQQISKKWPVIELL
jgi:hypothetical protein